MFENIIQNQGFNIALSGIVVVFTGLILIAAVIQLFNKIFEKAAASTDAQDPSAAVIQKRKPGILKGKPVPPDHLTAIAVALEIYRKLYFDIHDSKVTFERGAQQSNWKAGAKFGQRSYLQR